jgi:hypothetical protein
MAVEREPVKLDFGIDTNFSSQPEILSHLYGEEDKTPPAKPAVKKPVVQKEEEDQPETLDKKITLTDDDIFGEDDEDEEKVEEEKETEDEEEKEEEKVEDEDESVYSSVAKDFLAQGIWSKDEDEEIEINTPEEFRERALLEGKKTASFMIDSFLTQKGPEYKEAFDAIFVKGINPREFYSSKIQIDDYKTLDLTDDSVQERIVKSFLQEQGLDAEDVEAEVSKLKNYQELEETAKRYHKVGLKKQEQAQSQKLEKAAQEAAKIKEQKDQYNNNVFTILSDKLKSKDFDGIPISKDFAQDTLEFLTTEKFKAPDGKMLTSWDKLTIDLKKPENYQKLIKVAMLALMVDKDPSLSVLKRKLNTQRVDTKFEHLNKHSKTKTEKVTTKDNKNKFTI